MLASRLLSNVAVCSYDHHLRQSSVSVKFVVSPSLLRTCACIHASTVMSLKLNELKPHRFSSRIHRTRWRKRIRCPGEPSDQQNARAAPVRFCSAAESVDTSDGEDFGVSWTEQLPHSPTEAPEGANNLPTASEHLETQGFASRSSHRARVEANERNWARVRGNILSTYIANYPDTASSTQRRLEAAQRVFEDRIKDPDVCACPSCGNKDNHHLHTAAKVLVVSITQRFQLRVPRFQCVNCGLEYSIKPTQLGCLPCTPVEGWDLVAAGDSQVTWVDLQLAQLCDLMVVVQRRQSIEAIVDIVDGLHNLNNCSTPLNLNTFRKQLSDVMVEYSYIVCETKDMAAMGVEGFPDGALSQCGGCWEVSLQPEDGGARKPLEAVCFDCIFKVPLLSTVADKYGEDAVPHNHKYFLKDVSVKRFVANPAAAAVPDADKACADFHADKATARDSSKYAITGLGSALCRHGHILNVLNIFTGEKYAYATNVLFNILAEHKIPLKFVYYDINCRYKASFEKFLDSVPVQVKAVLQDALAVCTPQFPIPPFHKYAHSATCQRKHSALKMEGAGRGFGEPNEIFNAYVGPCGGTTQYMSPVHRQARLERVFLHYTDQKIASLPQQLMDMAARAQVQLSTASQDMLTVKDMITERFGLSDDEIHQRLWDLRQLEQETTPACLPLSAQYAKCRLVVYWAERAESERLPSLMLLFPDRKLAKLAPNSAYVKACRRQLEQLRTALQLPTDVPLRSAEFAAMFSLLRDAMVKQQQGEVEQLSRERWLLNLYMQKVAGRPREAKSVLRNLQKSKAKIDDALQQLKAWATGLFFGQPAAMSDAVTWRLEDVLQLHFPWDPSPAEENEECVNGLIMKLQHHMHERRRAEEELEIVERERASLLALHDKQINAMRQHIEVLCKCLVDLADQLADQGLVHDVQGAKNAAEKAQQSRHVTGTVALVQQRLAFIEGVAATARQLFSTASEEGDGGSAVEQRAHGDGYDTCDYSEAQSDVEEPSDGELDS